MILKLHSIKSCAESTRTFQVAIRVVCVLGLAAVSFTGCATRKVNLPSTDQFEREQLRVFSDFRLPRRHRLLDELTARRRDIADRLLLPISDEPINVYLFGDEGRFKKYLKQNHPHFPARRAFFVKNDTDLQVFAHWGQHVGEDLRHEVTHGYLHSVVPNVPLWLDEGLAEYFELPRGSNGFHTSHIFLLTEQSKLGNWKPSLPRLEAIGEPNTLTQIDYAESWLWVHFLLESGDDELKKTLQDQLARVRMTGNAEPLSSFIAELYETPETAVFDHLVKLNGELKHEEVSNEHETPK